MIEYTRYSAYTPSYSILDNNFCDTYSTYSRRVHLLNVLYEYIMEHDFLVFNSYCVNYYDTGTISIISRGNI